MNGFTKVLLLASMAIMVSAQEEQRDPKSLTGVFPFNNGRDNRQQAHAHHDHHDHHHDHPLPARRFQGEDQRDARQRQQVRSQGAGPVRTDEVDLSLGAIAAAKERCVDKVVMETVTEYDDEITCKHSYTNKCHTTYTTDFEPQQEEECEETFTKNCFIEYKKTASDEKVQFCHTPLVCKGEGDPECRTVYESRCNTTFHKHDVVDDVVNCTTIQDEKCVPVTKGYTTENKCSKWPRQVCTTTKVPVTKHTPETHCGKFPTEVCGPVGCDLQPGPEECFDKTETVVTEVPVETCNLEPQKTCKFVTKLVPWLKPVEECVDIPKEVCSRSRTNPHPVERPVIKKWCYVPTEESGLA